jgi:integrase
LKRAEAKLALADGRNPGAKEVEADGITFEKAARAWHENRLASLNEGHGSRLLTRLERDAFKVFGQTDLRKLTSADVLAMIRSVEARGALDVSRGSSSMSARSTGSRSRKGGPIQTPHSI